MRFTGTRSIGAPMLQTLGLRDSGIRVDVLSKTNGFNLLDMVIFSPCPTTTVFDLFSQWKSFLHSSLATTTHCAQIQYFGPFFCLNGKSNVGAVCYNCSIDYKVAVGRRPSSLIPFFNATFWRKPGRTTTTKRKRLLQFVTNSSFSSP